MLLAILQAVHGGKDFFFLNGWKEGDPDCKFPTLHPCCIEEKAWKCRWKVRPSRNKKPTPNCHAFGKMQPGYNGENLRSGSSSFYSSKKNSFNFHVFPVMSWATLSKIWNSVFFAKRLSDVFLMKLVGRINLVDTRVAMGKLRSLTLLIPQLDYTSY